MKPQEILAYGLLLACAVLMVRCTKQETAKAEYGEQLKACVRVGGSRAEVDACVKAEQDKWTEAGAKPALDGGAE